MESKHPLTEYLVRKYMGYPKNIRENIFKKLIQNHPVIKKLNKDIADLEDEMGKQVDYLIKKHPGLEKSMADFDAKRKQNLDDLDYLDKLDKEEDSRRKNLKKKK